MNKISLDSIEKAAKRIAAKHFFTDVNTQEEVDGIWEMIEQSADDENEATERFLDTIHQVWQPFANWQLMEVFDEVCNFRNSIVAEMTEELL